MLVQPEQREGEKTLVTENMSGHWYIVTTHTHNLVGATLFGALPVHSWPQHKRTAAPSRVDREHG